MNAKLQTRSDTRAQLIEAGTEVMLEKGYTNSGIQEVLSRVGVPKGSFYHYFDSKEDFAVAIVEAFDTYYTAKINKALTDETKEPIERLRTYCLDSRDWMSEGKCKNGCLLGNLSQEMSDQSEILREKLSSIMTKRREMFARCIAEGQSSGNINPTWEAHKTAELFLCGWDGAMMRSKTTKSLEPLDGFIMLMIDKALRP